MLANTTWFVPEPRQIVLGLSALKVYFGKRGLPPKYLRKWHYNFLIENSVPESVCDFVQGRSLGKSVGGMHYLAKTKQADRFYSRVAEMFPALGGKVVAKLFLSSLASHRQSGNDKQYP